MSTRSSTGLAAVAVFVGLLCINIVQPQLASAAKPQTSEVYAPFGCMDCDVVGSARLVRTPNGISLNLRTTELDPHAAYTVWFVIFNNPEECAAALACTPDDLGTEAVMATIIWGTGHVVGGNGIGNFGAHLAVGDTSDAIFPLPLPGDDVGLIDSMEAQVVIVVRSHGLKIPGMVVEQTTTYNGVGCEDFLPDPDHDDDCEDQQFAVFPRP